jgi:hypothetical protein
LIGWHLDLHLVVSFGFWNDMGLTWQMESEEPDWVVGWKLDSTDGKSGESFEFGRRLIWIDRAGLEDIFVFLRKGLDCNGRWSCMHSVEIPLYLWSGVIFVLLFSFVFMAGRDSSSSSPEVDRPALLAVLEPHIAAHQPISASSLPFTFISLLVAWEGDWGMGTALSRIKYDILPPSIPLHPIMTS